MSLGVLPKPPQQLSRPAKYSSGRGVKWIVRQGRWGYVMVAASTLGLALFQLGPLVWAMAESLSKFNPITHKSMGFVGAANFESVLGDSAFWMSFVNTIAYCLATAVLEVVLGLGIAMLLDRALPITPAARTSVVAALALSESVTALLWFSLLDADIGPMNGLLSLLGIERVGWLISSPAAMVSVVLVAVWHDVGLVVLIYLAGLQGLDDELFNAAAVDGANAFQQFIHVTLPGLRRSSVLVVFVVTIAGLRIFTPINLMTQGGPGGSSSSLVYYVYGQSMKNLDYGMASAATVFLIVLVVVVTVIEGAAMRRMDD
jgi:ABC-type sugar transport system permease subunit